MTQPRRSRHDGTRRAIALLSALALITPLALATLALPAGASSVPGTPGTPVAHAMPDSAAVRWSAPANVGSPPLTGYRVEVNDGVSWSTANVVHGAAALVAGGGHTCALLDAGTVKCWGHNGNGELGLGDGTNRGDDPGEMGANLPTVDLGTGRTATAITAGNNDTCALLNLGDVKCWGVNDVGQLGQGDLTNRGAGPNQMGDNLPAIDLGTGRKASAIAAGADFNCALLDNATVKCWGDGGLGHSARATPTTAAPAPTRWATTSPPSTSEPAAPRSPSRPPPRTRARCSTTGPSSAGATTTTGNSARATPTTAAPAPTRWATTSPPSTSAPAAPPPSSPRVATRPARCSTTPRSSAGASTSSGNSASATPRIAATTPTRWVPTSRPSTSAPAAPPPPSASATATCAPCSTTPRSSAGATTASDSSARTI